MILTLDFRFLVGLLGFRRFRSLCVWGVKGFGVQWSRFKSFGVWGLVLGVCFLGI